MSDPSRLREGSRVLDGSSVRNGGSRGCVRDASSVRSRVWGCDGSSRLREGSRVLDGSSVRNGGRRGYVRDGSSVRDGTRVWGTRVWGCDATKKVIRLGKLWSTRKRNVRRDFIISNNPELNIQIGPK